MTWGQWVTWACTCAAAFGIGYAVVPDLAFLARALRPARRYSCPWCGQDRLSAGQARLHHRAGEMVAELELHGIMGRLPHPVGSADWDAEVIRYLRARIDLDATRRRIRAEHDR